MNQVNWLLAAGLGVAAAIEIALPVVAGILLARCFGGRWRYWFLGVGVFFVFQLLTRIPAMVVLQTLPPVKEALQQTAFAWAFLAFAAITAGLFEEGGRWIAFRFLIAQDSRRWSTALMLGAGHGGLESIAVGLTVVLGLVGYLAIHLLPAEALEQYADAVADAQKEFAGMHAWVPLLGAWERVGALILHISFSVIVLQAFRRGAAWWWWYAFLAHTLVDFTTVGLLRLLEPTWGRYGAMVAVEVLVGVYAVLALVIIWRLRDPAVLPAEPQSPTEP